MLQAGALLSEPGEKPKFAMPWIYTVHGILQATILEWVVFPFSRGSSQPRDWTQVSQMQVDSLPAEPAGKYSNCKKDSDKGSQLLDKPWK